MAAFQWRNAAREVAPLMGCYFERMRLGMTKEDESSRRSTIHPPASAPSVTVSSAGDDVSPEASEGRPSSPGSAGTRRNCENLAPLIQFLHKNIGRRWTDVYKEICRVVAPGSVAQKQVLDHVGSLVATSVLMIDGRPHRPTEGNVERYRFQPLNGSKWDSLYVCPTTGLLKSVERTEEPLRRTNPDVRPIGPLSQYRRINGIWYLVELAFIPSIVSTLGDHYDVLLHAPLAHLSCDDLKKMYGSYDRYAVSKRPLGKRELLRLTDVLGSS